MIFFRLALIGALLSLSAQTHAETNAETSAECPASSAAAASRFIALGVNDPGQSVTLLRAGDLGRLRARLAHMFSDRYSPASRSLRELLLGPDWTEERTRNSSDTDLVGAYLANSARRNLSLRLSNTQVVDVQETEYMGHAVEVSYQIIRGDQSITQKRTINAVLDNGCWKVRLPDEAWVRIALIAKELKASRPSALPQREGQPRIKLNVAPASRTPFPRALEVPLRSEDGSVESIWIDSNSLVTETNVAGAVANWACDRSETEPETAAIRIGLDRPGARRLNAWTRQNVGGSVTVVIDGEAKMFATVRDVLDDQLNFCVPSATLDEAAALAAALLGRQ